MQAISSIYNAIVVFEGNGQSSSYVVSFHISHAHVNTNTIDPEEVGHVIELLSKAHS